MTASGTLTETRTPRATAPVLHVRGILLAALAMRAFIALALFVDHPVSALIRTRSEIFAISISLASGHGFSSPFFTPSGPTAFLSPGYPLLVAGIFKLLGIGTAAAVTVLVLQVFLSLLIVWGVIRLACRHFGTQVANIAGLMCAFSLPLAAGPYVVWESCLSSLLLLGFLALVPQVRTRGQWAIAGAVTALAALVNPALLPTLVGLAFLQAVRLRRIPWMGLAVCLLLYAPWPARNLAVMHAFIPLRSNFGYELWMGNHPGGDGDFHQDLNPQVNSEERSQFVALGELAFMRAKTHAAEDTIRTHPGQFLLWTLRRVVRFWTGATHGMVITGALFSLLALAGLFTAWRTHPDVRAWAIPLLLYPLPYYVTHPDARFRYVIDPLLAILAAYAIHLIYARLQRRQASPQQPA